MKLTRDVLAVPLDVFNAQVKPNVLNALKIISLVETNVLLIVVMDTQSRAQNNVMTETES